jgi:hypothetical protein
MDLSSLLGFINETLAGDYLFWGIVALSGVVGVVAVVNALDMFFEAEAG